MKLSIPQMRFLNSSPMKQKINENGIVTWEDSEGTIIKNVSVQSMIEKRFMETKIVDGETIAVITDNGLAAIEKFKLPEFVCYYIKNGPYFEFMVPRFNGDGFVRKPFGGGTINQAYKRWRQPRFASVAFEGDGYVRLRISLDEDNIIQKVISEIKHAFPRITKYEKLTEVEFNKKLSTVS